MRIPIALSLIVFLSAAGLLFAAPPAQATSTPGTPSFSSIAATSTVVSWGAASGATSYNLEQCITSTANCSLFANIGSNSTTTYSLTGDTSYDYAVQGVTSGGNTAFSATSTILTLPNIPGAPGFSSVTATTLTVSWTAPSGGAATYKVGRCTGLGCNDFVNIAAGVSGTSYSDSGLSPNTTYEYEVLGSDSTGDGLYSSANSVTTSQASYTTTPRVIYLLGGIRLLGGVRLR